MLRMAKHKKEELKKSPVKTKSKKTILPTSPQTRNVLTRSTRVVPTMKPVSIQSPGRSPKKTNAVEQSDSPSSFFTTTSTTPQFYMPRLIQSNGTEYLTFAPNSAQHWRQWLDVHHDKCKAIWLVFYTKSSGIPSIDYPVAVDQAICYGWIDSTRKSFKNMEFSYDPEGQRLRQENKEECRYFQLFTPRNVKTSTWSRVNKAKVERLIADGLMHRAGLKVIDEAKANGQWSSLDDVENLTIPDDLALAFTLTAANQVKKERFEALPRSDKRIMLLNLHQAKRQDTRDKRIANILDQL